MSRPTQPDMNDPVWTDTPLSIQQWMDEADAYITAIEQELDEAVRILDDVCETFGHVDALCVDEAVEFLGRVEGGDNVG